MARERDPEHGRAFEEVLPTFVGFFPKRTAAPPPPLAAVGVHEIGSVSHCLSVGPPDWIDRWLHNRYGFFDSERVAATVAGSEDYDLYAYALLPVRTVDGDLEPFAVEPITEKVPEDYVYLGVDVVSRSTSDFFECSPLSCNLAGVDVSVNEFCLLPDAEAGLRFLQKVGRDGGYEPGPYYLVSVWKKQRTGREVAATATQGMIGPVPAGGAPDDMVRRWTDRQPGQDAQPTI